jgi:hypothetical protein
MEDSTMWVPICCGRVMRHSQFPGQGGKFAAAMLTCGSCGKHITLEPQAASSLQDYGQGSHLFTVLGTIRASERKAHAGQSAGAGELGDETLQ